VALVGAIAIAGSGRPAWSGLARAATSLVGLPASLAGLLLSVRGVWDLRRSLSPFPRPRRSAELVDRGVYALARHPIYGGQIVAAVGWGLWRASPIALALAAVAAVFFSAKSAREEAWLVGRFPGYDAYRRRTRRLIPGIW
jgi:protein-S-isoprenylcysteine O-methyltransferase Ste14